MRREAKDISAETEREDMIKDKSKDQRDETEREREERGNEKERDRKPPRFRDHLR
jgi:hypothetical protein